MCSPATTRHAQAIRQRLMQGVVTARQLADTLEVSQPTISRVLASMQEHVVRMGAARSIQYALLDERRSGLQTAVYRVGTDGRLRTLGQLLPVWPEGFVMQQTDGRSLHSEELLWWLLDGLPQGYLGRAFAQRFAQAHPDLGLPPRLSHWSDSHGLLALLHAVDQPAEQPWIPLIALFDHEEVGSATTTGAAGPILEDVLVRIAAVAGFGVDATRAMYARSSCISADCGHAVHPNYASRHDPQVRPLVNEGPLLKINANQRYATDATGAAIWTQACDRAGVPTQPFVSNNDVPCGSTIGPITATRLGITTVDVGIGLLSMHSAREMCGAEDPHYLARAIEAFWEC